MDYSGKIIRKTPVVPSQTSASGVWQLDEAMQATKSNTWPVANVPNPISRSLRFRRSASAWLSRTPATTTNRRTYTLSAWVKLGQLVTSHQQILRVNTDPPTALRFEDIAGQYGQLRFFSLGSSTANLISTAFYRDPSAWYHVVLAVDTTQATSSNRVKMYVNGVQITAFDTAVYPDQNFETSINLNAAHGIGATSTGEENLDGYLTEVNFIDGQALTPSSFGGTNAVTGVWEPRQYTGTYGTNGFYLNFKDNTSTTTLGYDYSGNSNTWTTNNISLTAGSTYDSMLDVPTQWIGYNTGDVASVTRGNYCTLNPLDRAAIDLTAANLTFQRTSSTTDWEHSRATFQLPSTGKWYWESTFNSGSNDGVFNGVATSTANLSTDFAAGTFAGFYGYTSLNGSVINNNSSSTLGSSLSNGDIVMIAVDVANSNLWIGVNGTWLGSGNPATNTNASIGSIPIGVFPVCGSRSTGNGSVNFGQRPFTYTPPAGFLSLCTTNLPNPTILQGNDYFNPVLYTGNGGTQSITGVGFQPDFVWAKPRSAADNHMLYDVVRGVQKGLFTNLTSEELTSATTLTAFNSDGFSVGTDSGINGSGRTFVAWNWKANGTGVTNTAGSITSTVSANTTAGFSIVTYTGNSTAGATIGHGLGVAPSFIITKTRSTSIGNWGVYHRSLGATQSLNLNNTGAAFTSSLWWNNTAPTSTVFSVGTGNDVNGASTYVAYCFAAVPGYSAFGSYTGNDSADGVFVYLGFKPKFLLIKNTSVSGDWVLIDATRSPYNVSANKLYPNLSNAENSTSTDNSLDILSNGFKLRGDAATNDATNGPGNTMIYMAFSESPFKNALAR